MSKLVLFRILPLIFLVVCGIGVTKQPTAQTPPAALPVAPIVVQVHEPEKSPEELAQEKEDRAARRANDEATLSINRQLVRIGFWQLVIFALQLAVFGFQALKLHQTVKAANKQSADMRASIAESARSATALENLVPNVAASAQSAAESVATVRERTALQMRAYIGMIIGNAVYQERDKNIRFAAHPIAINGGNTPARNVRYAARAAILPVPITPDVVLPPIGDLLPVGGMMGPHQNSTLSAVVDDYVPDEDVEAIKTGAPRALAVWGRVAYVDIFGQEHTTDFCQTVLWLPNGQIYGYHVPGRNDAT